MAHSVHQRLLNLARASERPFNELLQYYAMERFLYRLAHTGYGEALLLKGALLLRVWGLPSARPTMDIDLMGVKEFSPSELVAVVKESMSVVTDDGLIFHPETIAVEAIDEDGGYQGWRLLFRANLGNARIHLQVDVGLGDVVVPSPVWIELPTQLDFPAPRLLAYTPESVIAEKFQAMVALEKVNSRMKDFYDLWALGAEPGLQGSPHSGSRQSNLRAAEDTCPGTDAFGPHARIQRQSDQASSVGGLCQKATLPGDHHRSS
jgi:predicted nucleotidyltransferase component of viral defense system